VTNLPGHATASGERETRVYWSSDAEIGNDVHVATFVYSDTLAGGDSVVRSEMVTVPPLGSAGLGWLVVAVDTRHAIIESDRSNNVAISEHPVQVPLELLLTSSVSAIREDAADPRVRIVVTRTGHVGTPLDVSLSSSDTSELTVPEQVTIPAGSYSVAFHALVQNDGIVDPDQTVLITATAEGTGGATLSIVVINAQRPSLTLDIQPVELVEGSVATATVTRELVTDAPLEVTLISSNQGQLAVPSRVTIPAGDDSVTFPVTAVDDNHPEADRYYTVTATASGWIADSQQVLILDDDVPVLTFDLESTAFSEGAGPFATVGTIRRSPVTGHAVDVLLSSSNPGKAVVPALLRFPAHVGVVHFYVSAVDNLEVDGTHTVTLTAAPREPQTGQPIAAAQVSRESRFTTTTPRRCSCSSPTAWSPRGFRRRRTSRSAAIRARRARWWCPCR
jgi:hypothetical protein